MPYRIDLDDPPPRAFDALVELGALDVETWGQRLAAIMPDAVTADMLARALGGRTVRTSASEGRDDGSVWSVSPRRVRVGAIEIVPADMPSGPGTVRLVDGAAFGTGLHPTTALCLEAFTDLLRVTRPARVLDVGTGSGILALAALRAGVPYAVGLDIAADALRAASANARLNDAQGKLRLVRGGPDVVRGSWPLVLANIRAAELMAMAPAIVRRLASRGHVVLSGIPESVLPEVRTAYQRQGMTPVAAPARRGWTALVMRASW
jgi:ribosomal protein L11 methyltransferase